MKNVFQKISYQIRPFSRMQKKSGKHPFGLQIVINGDARLLPIDVLWFVNEFDYVGEVFRHSAKYPELVRDLNLILAKEKSRANDIITRYRLNDRNLSHKQFRWEFKNYTSRENVHDYLRGLADKLRNDGVVYEHTYHNYLSCFRRFKHFSSDNLPFSEITTALVLKFDSYLRKTFKHNTVSSTHVVLHKFFKQAAKDGLLLESPYNEKINRRYIEGDREALTLEELKQLIKLFENRSNLSETQLNVLEMFVFSATSGGYRFSELQTMTSDNVKFGVLRMQTIKGKKFGVQLHIDLPEIGLKIIENRKGKLFAKVSEQAGNREIKKLVAMADIKKHITFHSARDTFGTLYVYMGGDITTLSKEIFKHAKLETTMIYQKKSDDMKRKDMKNFDVFELPTLSS